MRHIQVKKWSMQLALQNFGKIGVWIAIYENLSDQSSDLLGINCFCSFNLRLLLLTMSISQSEAEDEENCDVSSCHGLFDFGRLVSE